jgi:hypothetical protein
MFKIMIMWNLYLAFAFIAIWLDNLARNVKFCPKLGIFVLNTFMRKITNMTIKQHFQVMSENFHVPRTFTSWDYSQQTIRNLCNYSFC